MHNTIPKIIHYCWFGNGEKTALIKKCIDSWKIFLPDYKIIEWSEENFDINNSNEFVKTAYKERKWAFVSDYVRAFALYEKGGIYLDTDVEIKRPLDKFLNHGAFSGFESKDYPFTALWGAQKGHKWPELVLKYYKNKSFSTKTNTAIVSSILIDYYKINPRLDAKQSLNDNIVIYPSSHFCIEIPKNYAVHHFEGSWTDHKESFKTEINNKYHINNIIQNNYTLRDVSTKFNLRYNSENREQVLNRLRTKDIFNYLVLKRFLKINK